MKKVYLIGFRGIGLRNPEFQNEPALIRVGHVGFTFEGSESQIYGFHPTQEAIRNIGGDEAAIAWLKLLKPLNGTLHLDTEIFIRANELAKKGVRTKVWQWEILLPDEEFERVRNQTLVWYTEQTLFNYSFPPEELLPDRDNCATFPRRLGLPLPEETGRLTFYIAILAEVGTAWYPQENENE